MILDEPSLPRDEAPWFFRLASADTVQLVGHECAITGPEHFFLNSAFRAESEVNRPEMVGMRVLGVALVMLSRGRNHMFKALPRHVCTNA